MRKGKQSGDPRDAKTEVAARVAGRGGDAVRGAHGVRAVAPAAAADHAVEIKHRAKRVCRLALRRKVSTIAARTSIGSSSPRSMSNTMSTRSRDRVLTRSVHGDVYA